MMCSLFVLAVEKAMTYLNTQELPWDMDLPHKKQLQQKKVLEV